MGTGVGLIVAGAMAGGFGHPELGHIRVVRRAGDEWLGACPFHDDCLEGLVSGPAIAARTGVPAQRLPADDPVWETVVFALGQLMHVLVIATAPRRILIGGGVVTERPYLFERVREALRGSPAGHRHAAELDDLDRYVMPPGLGTMTGSLGALALALAADAVTDHERRR